MQLKCGVDPVEVWKVEDNEGRPTLSTGKLISGVQVIIGRVELYLAPLRNFNSLDFSELCYHIGQTCLGISCRY